MELRKEYAGIVDGHVGGLSDIACERIELVALACQELADRPPRELTDAEIDKAWRTTTINDPLGDRIRSVLAAFIAKQREPQVVKFRAARRADTDRIEMFPSDFVFSSDMWEWLDADGKAQIYEVRT